ncbi:MAG: GNAT family protein [Balneolaceae bacterium]|nr:GNAT family protein [Balneolaceae bacterium]
MSDSRIRLRPLRKEDSDRFYRWITDRDLLLYNATYHPVSEYEHEEWVETMLEGRDDMVLFVIEHIEDEIPIGSCQLKEIHRTHRRAELQIRIGERDYWGQGLGTEAVNKLVRFAFQDLNLHRVQLEVHAPNTRAIKTYEKCGFEHEGTLKDAKYIDGEYIDVILMAILNT